MSTRPNCRVKYFSILITIVGAILIFSTGKVHAKSEVAPKVKKIKSWGQVFTG